MVKIERIQRLLKIAKFGEILSCKRKMSILSLKCDMSVRDMSLNLKLIDPERQRRFQLFQQIPKITKLVIEILGSIFKR